MRSFASPLLTLAAIMLAVSNAAQANSHLWRISEIFSNADGSVQFIEMVEVTGADAEIQLAGKSFLSNSKAFVFPSDLPGPTGFRTVLMATQGFAALPGAPVPDYIIPDAFFDPDGDSLVYYIYDRFDFGAGVVPTDGVLSVSRFGLQTAVNSPKNFAGDLGSVVAAQFTQCVLDVTATYAANTLELGFDLGVSENATWNVWLSIGNATPPLLSIPLGPIPLLTFPIAFAFPPSGTIGVLSTLTTTAGGILCSDFATVDTTP